MFRNALKLVFTLRGALTITFSVIGIFILMLLTSQASLLWSFINTGEGLGKIIKLTWGIISSSVNLFSPFSFVLIIVVGILFGINATLGRAYRLRLGKSGTQFSDTSKGVVALIASLFGVGCAACGPLLLANSIFAVTGITFFASLPLGGMEFALLGIIFLIWANIKLVRALHQPLVCKN